MKRTAMEWNTLIQNPKVSQRFAGTDLQVPVPGDKIKIIRGSDTGQVHTVIACIGHAYSLNQKIYVEVEGDTPTCYMPWDVEILHSS